MSSARPAPRRALTVLLLLALALLAATVPAATSAAEPGPATPVHDADHWRERVAAARSYALARRGVVTFAVLDGRRLHGYGLDRRAQSQSVAKAMLMVAYLSRPDVAFRDLRESERQLLAPMVRRSDNPTAWRVFGIVGQRGLRRVGDRAGMRRLRTDPIWWATGITAADQARFFMQIDALLPPRHRAYGMRLLETIVPSQRWGIGRVSLPAGWRLYFKGGWGTGTGAFDHQIALLTRGEQRISVAILTTWQGSHAYGNETLSAVAARLLRRL